MASGVAFPAAFPRAAEINHGKGGLSTKARVERILAFEKAPRGTHAAEWIGRDMAFTEVFSENQRAGTSPPP